MNISTTSIYWFRQDLRLSDNPALSKALENDSVIVIYILDTINPDQYFLGSASRWWLHNSLLRLNDDLGNRLSVYKGDPENIINNLCKQYNTQSIYWNRCYEPWRINRDKNLKKKYMTAFDRDMFKLIDCNAARQKWIDQSVSFNLYNKGTSLKYLNDIYMYCWESGLKTTYYLRNRAASKIEKATSDSAQPIEDQQADSCSLTAMANGEICESCQ